MADGDGLCGGLGFKRFGRSDGSRIDRCDFLDRDFGGLVALRPERRQLARLARDHQLLADEAAIRGGP